MLLTDKNINHLNAISHDGKVVCFGTDLEGVIWYTVKRSGFEDTAVAIGTDPFDFEGWQLLNLGAAVADPSVTANEQQTLADASGNVLVRTVYGSSNETTKSVAAPVQLVSSGNLLYVFRQAPTGRILVNRFVLDGMTNKLVPKLDVRFRRSRQRLTPHKPATPALGATFDGLDYRDIDGNSFYEGALELGFAGTVMNGWFSVINVPTIESERSRWHIFVVDAASSKLVLYTVGGGDDGLFDVKDYLFARPDPIDPTITVYRSIPGIIRRTIEAPGLTVANGPSATSYDLQKETMTDAGPRLIRDARRVMLAWPVRAGNAPARTAVIDFALAVDGTLSRIDLTPDTTESLRSDMRQVATPPSLMDDIKEIAAALPPPAGSIVATERGSDDQLQIRSKGALPANLAAGSKVKIRGTQSYDGHYKVLSVDGATFQVEATFANNEAGFWEVEPTGLVFDNQIVGTEKTADGKLKILCPAHDLKVGNELQISGTATYDGIFPITALVPDKNGFVLDAPFFTGEAANLTTVVRRGLRMDGNDSVETPDLALVPPSPQRDMGRTLSAWVKVDAAGNLEQSLIKDSGGMMSLSVGSDNKVKLAVRMSDGVTRTVTDPSAIATNTWVHYAGTLDYVTATGGNTRIALIRNGMEVAQQSVPHGLPSHLNDQLIAFDGVDDYVAVPGENVSFTAGITVEAWVCLENPAQASTGRGIFTEVETVAGESVQFSLNVDGAAHALQAGFFDGSWRTITASSGLPLNRWVHVAATYDNRFIRIYIDGVLIATSADQNRPLPTAGTQWRIGRRHDLGNPADMWNGRIADVRQWNRARTQAEIAQQLITRLTGREAGLVGYWPLDNGTAQDRSSAKRHGTLTGTPAWTRVPYLFPQITPPAAPSATLAKAMSFNGTSDYIEVPNAKGLFTGSFTVAMWAKVTGGRGTHRAAISCRGAGFKGFNIYAHDTNQWQFWYGDGSGWQRIAAANVVEGAWVHLAATLSGTTLTFYINGIPLAPVTAAYQPPDRPMRIGAGATEGPPTFYFNGLITDVQVWNVARAQADIQADMYRRLTGKESGLVGYWPLDRDTQDLSPNKRHGSFRGNPTLVNEGSAFTIGQGFRGEIANAEIWEVAQPAADVKATKHLDLSGKERGLAAYYRMGAISYEEQPPVVPDFSYHGRNGVVIGDPYAGARRLSRKTRSDLKVVRYGSEQLLAVSQRGVYEESFEFKVTTTDASFNPNRADASGQKLFAFNYWGKSSRGSKEILTIPAASVTQYDFTAIPMDSGWYTATCRVVIPDGMSLLRAFEISDVRGKWGAEASPPATEWTAIDIRKHRIRLISDAVTRDNYTDAAALASLPGQSLEVLANLAAIPSAESRVTRAEAAVRDFQARLAVAQTRQPYVDERTNVMSTLSNLSLQQLSEQTQLDALSSHRFYYKLRVKEGLRLADWRNAKLQPYQESGQDSQLWEVRDSGHGAYYLLTAEAVPRVLTSGEFGSVVVVENMQNGYREEYLWQFMDRGGGYSHIQTPFGTALAVAGAFEGSDVLVQTPHDQDHQLWAFVQTNRLTPTAQGNTQSLQALQSAIGQRNMEITAAQSRLAWLNQALNGNETTASVQALLTAAQTELTSANTNLAMRNKTFLDAFKASPALAPATMPAIATDDRDLVTTGAVLDFAEPTGSVRLAESSEGNVLLTYFDTQGRMRATPYDAAADSRNAAFEQWVPDAVRACADLRDTGDKITLAPAVRLPASGWTCEAWVQYPVATTSNGAPYATNVVAARGTGTDSPLIVQRGTRLGLMVDGWFFDSGVFDLSRTLAPGWHHLAAATNAGTTTFYADGRKLGSRTTTQPAIRLNGSTDYVEVKPFPNPRTHITVSVWARSATADWNSTGFLVSARDAFIMHPIQGKRTVQFYLWTNTGSTAADFTPDDIQGWHLYTATYNGSHVRLYIDGEFRAEKAITGTISAATGGMSIGHDPPATNGRYFNGDIAEVAIWSVARGPSDVREDLYRTFTGKEPGLFGYWRMDLSDGSGTIKDLASTPHHGVMRGNRMNATITTMRSMDITVLGNVAAGGSPIGRLAEVRLWNIGLSDAEVAVHSRVKASGDEPGLIGYWPLDEAAGTTAYDRAASGLSNGTMDGVGRVGCTANIGNPGTNVLSLPDSGGAYVKCPTVAIAGKSFTIECWVRRSGAGIGNQQLFASMGRSATNQGLFIGFRPNSKFTFGFWSNDLETSATYTETDWHHWCCTYDQPTKRQRIYRDGILAAERMEAANCTATGDLIIGCLFGGSDSFPGELAEMRVWDRVRTDAEIRTNMYRRATGKEANLLACYPLDEVSMAMTSGNAVSRVREKKTGLPQGEITGNPLLLLSTSMPGAGADHLIAAEYSTVEVSGDGTRQLLLRRFYGYTTGEYAQVLPEQRVEELTLQWIGNTQINPTLLGYVEGPPPVPSENLTEALDDGYGGAATVTLTQSSETGYSWQRSETTGSAFNLDGFVGVDVNVSAGFVVYTKLVDLSIGAQFNYEHTQTDAKDTSISATSGLTATDSLTLTGMAEDKAAFPAVGKRWVPKNVGYALVVSGTADVFLTRLKRSGRMVSYDVRPVDGVPLDVNTITFLINPAYTLNGSLDGMVGSEAADPTFYSNLPEMRAQYGSLFPASYFRLKEAYALKNAIEMQDKERESFFYNFNASQIDNIDAIGQASGTTLLPGLSAGGPTPKDEDGNADQAAAEADADRQKTEAMAEAEKRQAEIEGKHKSIQGVVRATAAFADWQIRLERVQTRAGKRNIVNEYVWDGDGGLHAEEQSFASTIEHTISAETSDSGGAGLSLEGSFPAFGFELSLLGSGSKTNASSKTLSTSRSLGLAVDLSGLERSGITDLKDKPLVPGEKVDRYRFMSFYLEGSTDHFQDFFSYVVDPEWLASNDEEARALRQARTAKPNKTWRVLHRVTYVERPVLGALNKK